MLQSARIIQKLFSYIGFFISAIFKPKLWQIMIFLYIFFKQVCSGNQFDGKPRERKSCGVGCPSLFVIKTKKYFYQKTHILFIKNKTYSKPQYLCLSLLLHPLIFFNLSLQLMHPFHGGFEGPTAAGVLHDGNGVLHQRRTVLARVLGRRDWDSPHAALRWGWPLDSHELFFWKNGDETQWRDGRALSDELHKSCLPQLGSYMLSVWLLRDTVIRGGGLLMGCSVALLFLWFL